MEHRQSDVDPIMKETKLLDEMNTNKGNSLMVLVVKYFENQNRS